MTKRLIDADELISYIESIPDAFRIGAAHKAILAKIWELSNQQASPSLPSHPTKDTHKEPDLDEMIDAIPSVRVTAKFDDGTYKCDVYLPVLRAISRRIKALEGGGDAA